MGITPVNSSKTISNLPYSVLLEIEAGWGEGEGEGEVGGTVS